MINDQSNYLIQTENYKELCKEFTDKAKKI